MKKLLAVSVLLLASTSALAGGGIPKGPFTECAYAFHCIAGICRMDSVGGGTVDPNTIFAWGKGIPAPETQEGFLISAQWANGSGPSQCVYKSNGHNPGNGTYFFLSTKEPDAITGIYGDRWKGSSCEGTGAGCFFLVK